MDNMNWNGGRKEKLHSLYQDKRQNDVNTLTYIKSISTEMYTIRYPNFK